MICYQLMNNYPERSPYEQYFYDITTVSGYQQYYPPPVSSASQLGQPTFPYPKQQESLLNQQLKPKQHHPKYLTHKPAPYNPTVNLKRRPAETIHGIQDDAYLKLNSASTRNKQKFRPKKPQLQVPHTKQAQGMKVRPVQEPPGLKKEQPKQSVRISVNKGSPTNIPEESISWSDDSFEEESEVSQGRRKEETGENARRALLKYFQNDQRRVDECLYECGLTENQGRTLDRYQSNFLILKYMGYTRRLYHWEVLKMLQKNNNNLEETIQRLNKRTKVMDHDDNVEEILKDTKANYVEVIAKDSIVLVDGFNVVRTNKYLKNLTVRPDQNSKLEAILRLKTFVETLVPGYLVLDKKLGDEEAEKSIMGKIGIELKKQKLMKVEYADPGTKADDKIVEILRGMGEEERKRVLLVTADRLLIKECQDICGEEMEVIGGKVFITQCKLLLPQGLKHKILTGK